jgi:hypothetical protein
MVHRGKGSLRNCFLVHEVRRSPKRKWDAFLCPLLCKAMGWI